MGSANGLHHLAIATRDVKKQLDFFTDVVGGELVALYWMHGVEKTVHAFVRFGDTASIAFVQSPDVQHIEPVLGVSKPGFVAGEVAPGAMQHLALNVDSEAELLAIRDRVRSRGHWIMGPADHGFCKSIYMVAPEGIMLEFSTWTDLDTDEWIDPEVMAHCGMDAADVARFRNPQPVASKGGKVPQPQPKPGFAFEFPHAWKERGEALYRMNDEQLCAVFSDTTPPARRVSAAAPGKPKRVAAGDRSR
jgi:catechol 2,3-dioxygenase-like lactoylglutathione lyase family enzyme